MANKQAKVIEIRGTVHGGSNGGKYSWVFATVVDLDLVKGKPEYTSVPLLCGTQADGQAKFVLEVPDWFVNLIVPDREAQVLVHAVDPSGETGASFAQLKADQAAADIVIELGTYGRPSKDKGPLQVEFSAEVLDALIGGSAGGAVGSTLETPTVLDDRFFEDRLRRLVGANVRSGDIAGLRREIDRVVVEEIVEGEPQFVFRGPGSARAARAPKLTTNGDYAVTNGRPPDYPAASRIGSVYRGGNVSGGYGGSSGGENLAGDQAILYRRTAAEIGYAREALASLQPVEPLDSPQFEAVRGLVGDGMTDLLEAFGNELRPPVARVNGVFEDLLDTKQIRSTNDSQVCNQQTQPPPKGTPQYFGFIGELGLQAGILNDQGCLVDDFVQTVADDRAVTRFNELATFLTSLRDQWEVFRDSFATAFTEPTLSTLGAILNRRLGLVADATRELELAIETSPGDSGERFFTEIPNTGTTLDEFLSWLNGYIDDSREQLRDASRVGLQGIGSEATRLANVAAAAGAEAARSSSANDDAIIGRRLVKRALEELEKNLRGIAEATN
jgi:hypothetical protein